MEEIYKVIKITFGMVLNLIKAMAGQVGASKEEINYAKFVIEKFVSFNAVANSYREMPCNIRPKD